MFFPSPGRKDLAEVAKNICRICPVREACDAEQAALRVRHGIWAGHTHH